MRLLSTLALLVWLGPAFAQDASPPLPQQRTPADAQVPLGDNAPVSPDASVALPPPTEPAGDTPPLDGAPADPGAEPLPADIPAPADGATPMPKPRPDRNSAPVPDAPPANAMPANPRSEPGAEGKPPTPAPSEPAKPPRVYQTACPAVVMGHVEAKALPPISEGQCGERSPLSVTGVLVNGRMVPLSGAVVTGCQMATMLPLWAADVDGYLWARENTRLESITVGTSYMCRNRNVAGGSGDVSEHGFAAAVDVVGLKFADGRTVTVQSGWNGPDAESRVVKFAHDAACTRFMTTLGPEANALHHDHLHFDMGCHGKACTARLCE